MKKIKDIWNRNRVLITLALIVLICFGIMGTIVTKYFFGVNVSNYGDRLEDIADLPFKDEDKEKLITALKGNELVEDVTVNVQGKVIKTRILFNSKAALDTAKQAASSVLGSIAKEYQEKYDLQFTIVQEATAEVGGFTLMGAKNINRTQIIWNNNTPIKAS